MKGKSLSILLITLFFVGLLLSACADPRKNCNHPDHGRYMNEKLMKKNKF